MKFLISILLIFTIVATIGICVKRPVMHKAVLVYDSGYTLVTEEEVTTVEKEEYPVMTQVQQPVEEKLTINEKIDNQIAQEQSQTTYYTTSKQSPQTTVTEQNNISKQQTSSNQDQVTKTQKVSKPVQTTTTLTQPFTPTKTETTLTKQTPVQTTNTKHENTSTVQNNTYTQPAPVGQTTNTTVAKAPIGNTKVVVTKPTTVSQPISQTSQPKVLTAQEEEIAWNKWRSNLQNSIMRDSRLPNMPLGTVFKFSFTVDKYGKVTNVKTWSTDARYTPYAIQYIAPTIRSYQGHSILNFPAGSNRVITDVTGSWRIATSASYSSPSDFNDIEKVTR